MMPNTGPEPLLDVPLLIGKAASTQPLPDVRLGKGAPSI